MTVVFLGVLCGEVVFPAAQADATLTSGATGLPTRCVRRVRDARGGKGSCLTLMAGLSNVKAGSWTLVGLGWRHTHASPYTFSGKWGDCLLTMTIRPNRVEVWHPMTQRVSRFARMEISCGLIRTQHELARAAGEAGGPVTVDLNWWRRRENRGRNGQSLAMLPGATTSYQEMPGASRQSCSNETNCVVCGCHRAR